MDTDGERWRARAEALRALATEYCAEARELLRGAAEECELMAALMRAALMMEDERWR